jgi:cell division protein FtsQ
MSVAAKPILAEPDQRYWRRKANRRVRKARLTQRFGRWSLMALAFAVVGAALFQAGSSAVESAKTRAGLAVESIVIHGTQHGTADAVRGLLTHLKGQSLLDLNLYHVATLAETDPWVLGATAKRVLPGVLEITVTERTPAAVARIEGADWLVGAQGWVVTEKVAGSFDSLPLLTGLDGFEGTALEQALLRGVTALGALRQEAGSWVDGVAAVDLSQGDRLALRTIDPGPLLLLDPEQVPRNLTAYLELRREIGRRAGPVNYVDLRWKDRITVRPDSSVAPLTEEG